MIFSVKLLKNLSGKLFCQRVKQN